MKRKFLLPLIAIATTMMGCSKEQQEQQGATSTKNITIYTDQTPTRAQTTSMTRYVLEIYAGTNFTTALHHLENATGTFTTELTQGKEYTLVAWADYGTPNNNTTGLYNALSLKAIKVITGKTPTDNTPSGEAFGGKQTLTVDATSGYDLTIKHAVAQVNFIQKEALTKAGNTLEVTFPKTYLLDLANNTATEILNSSASVPATYRFANIPQVSANTKIATSYIIASTDPANKILLDLKATFNTNEAERDITSVPFTLNHRTNITGAYSDMYDMETSSTCDDQWDKPDNNQPFPVVLPKIGYYVYGDGTCSKVYKPNPTPASLNLETRAASDTCIGVVYWVDPVVTNKAKVITMAHVRFYGEWGPDTDIPGSYSRTDGRANTLAIKNAPDFSATNYKCMHWCVNKKDGALDWYVPSVEQMKEIDKSTDIIHAAFKAVYPQVGKYDIAGCNMITSTTVGATKLINFRFSTTGNQNGSEQEVDKALNASNFCIAVADIMTN